MNIRVGRKLGGLFSAAQEINHHHFITKYTPVFLGKGLHALLDATVLGVVQC